ncbi:MAG: helix-hairpin-helix domain-containing protein [Promethearchaeota archaeon]
MEKEPSLIALVNSPAKDAHKRNGSGFSLKEIKDAGKNVQSLMKLNIKIDYFRKSAYATNIETLKSLKIPTEKSKKKKPFVMKEKKKTPFKPKVKKPKTVTKKPIEKKSKITTAKFTTKPKMKEEKKPPKLEKISSGPVGTPLTELSGLGGATAKKFIELGVNNVEDLCKENPEELATLIKGVSLDRLKKWIDEGNKLIK